MGRKDFALYLQSRSSAVFQVDINPAARIGKGIMLDHATGFVVGGNRHHRRQCLDPAGRDAGAAPASPKRTAIPRSAMAC
jgi:hypothetical protein